MELTHASSRKYRGGVTAASQRKPLSAARGRGFATRCCCPEEECPEALSKSASSMLQLGESSAGSDLGRMTQLPKGSSDEDSRSTGLPPAQPPVTFP